MKPSRKSQGFVDFLLLVIVMVIFVGLYYIHAGAPGSSAGTYNEGVSMQEISGFPAGSRFYTDTLTAHNNGWFIEVWDSPSKSSTYVVNGTVAKKSEKPPARPVGQLSENVATGKSKIFKDGAGLTYEIMVNSGEPAWDCTLSRVDTIGKKALVHSLNGFGCADVYAGKKGQLLVVVWGDSSQQQKTKVYMLQNGEAKYLKAFEDMSALTLVYDKGGDEWFAGTISTDANDIETDRLFRVTIR